MSRERASRSKIRLTSATILGLLLGWCAISFGEGKAVPDARVVVVQDPTATDSFKARFEPVKTMVDRAILAYTGATNLGKAWSGFVTPKDVVGIKVYSLPGALSGTRKAVVQAVVEGILKTGIPATNVIIWDKQWIDLHQAGFDTLAERLGVQILSSSDAGYDSSAFYESPLIGNLVWGDLEFGKSSDTLGRKSFVSHLLTQRLTKIINITPLLNHNVAGVSGNLYSLAMGSVDNATRFETDPGRLAQAVPEIYALQWLSDKVVLNITDALVCQYEGGERSLLHYSVTPNELWVSKDPVALDTLALREIVQQREQLVGSPQKPNEALYANAALLELGINDTNRIHISRLSNSQGLKR